MAGRELKDCGLRLWVSFSTTLPWVFPVAGQQPPKEKGSAGWNPEGSEQGAVHRHSRLPGCVPCCCSRHLPGPSGLSQDHRDLQPPPSKAVLAFRDISPWAVGVADSVPSPVPYTALAALAGGGPDPTA